MEKLRLLLNLLKLGKKNWHLEIECKVEDTMSTTFQQPDAIMRKNFL